MADKPVGQVWEESLSNSRLTNALRRIPLGYPTLAAIGTIASLAIASAADSRNCDGLSTLLLLTYQAGWVVLAIHHLIHVREGYFIVGLARPTWYEFGIVVCWGAVAVAIVAIDGQALLPLTICWLVSIALYFLCATKMERARRKLKGDDGNGYRARRCTDVIRESEAWAWLCRQFAQVEDETVDEFRKRLSQPDTEDGNLSNTTWFACCSGFAISLVAAAGTLGSVVAPEQSTPAQPHHEKKSHVKTVPQKTDPSVPEDEATAEVEPPEADDCAAGFNPTKVPEPMRKSLSLAWHDVDGLDPEGPMEALGSDIAGCPGKAQPIPGLPGSWFVPGTCNGHLQGIAIALSGMHHPVYLLEQAGEFALPLIRAGRFVGAEDRFEVGGGDAYVIHSRAGSFVLIRDDASEGLLGESERGDGSGCESYADRDVAYSVAGPGAIEAWRAAAAASNNGVYPIAWSDSGDGEARLALRERNGGIVTVLHCVPSLLSCEGTIDGQRRRWSDEAYIAKVEVEALVEP